MTTRILPSWAATRTRFTCSLPTSTAGFGTAREAGQIDHEALRIREREMLRVLDRAVGDDAHDGAAGLLVGRHARDAVSGRGVREIRGRSRRAGAAAAAAVARRHADVEAVHLLDQLVVRGLRERELHAGAHAALVDGARRDGDLLDETVVHGQLILDRARLRRSPGRARSGSAGPAGSPRTPRSRGRRAPRPWWTRRCRRAPPRARWVPPPPDPRVRRAFPRRPAPGRRGPRRPRPSRAPR